METHPGSVSIIAISPLLDDVVLAVETEFANWTKPNNTLRRLCAIT